MRTLERVFSTLLDLATSDRQEFVDGVSSLLQRRIGLDEPDSVRRAERLHASLIGSKSDSDCRAEDKTDLESLLKGLF